MLGALIIWGTQI